MKNSIKIFLGLTALFLILGGLINWQASRLLKQSASQNLKTTTSDSCRLLAAKISQTGRGEADDLLFVARLLPLRQYVTAASIRQQAAGKKIPADVLAKLLDRENKARTKLEEAFVAYVKDHPYYTWLTYLGRDEQEQVKIVNGAAVKTAAGPAGSLPAGLKSYPGKVTGWLSGTTGQDPKKTVWYLLTPVEVNKKSFGSLLAKIDLADWLDRLTRENLPPRSLVWLVDKPGWLLAGSGAGETAGSAKIRIDTLPVLKPYASEILLGDPGQTQLTFNRVAYWLSYQPVGQSDWTILTFLPETAGLENLGFFRISLGVLLLLALLITFGLMTAEARRQYQKPLAGLIKAVKNAAEGQTNLAWPSLSGAEPLAELGRQINNLVKQNQQNHLDLQIRLATLVKKLAKSEVRGRQLSDLLTALCRLEPQGSLKKAAEAAVDQLLGSGLLTAVSLDIFETVSRQNILKITRHLPQIAVPEDKLIWPVVLPLIIDSNLAGSLSLYSEEVDLKEPEIEQFLSGLAQFLGALLKPDRGQPVTPTAGPSAGSLAARSLLPPEILNNDLVALAGWAPALDPGHFFNYTLFAAEGYLDVVVGQVPGQGLVALTNLALLKGLLRARAATSTSPEEISQDVNGLICQEQVALIPTNLIYGVISFAGGSLTWTGAGPLPLAHRSAATAKVTFYRSKNLALGGQWETKYSARQLAIQAADTLVFLSQPLTAAEQAELKKVLVVAAALTPADLSAVLVEKLPQSAGIVLRINGPRQSATA